MKKLLSILTITLLTSTISINVISCNTNNSNSKIDSNVIKQIKSKNNFVWNDNGIILDNNKINLEKDPYLKYSPNWLYLLTAMQISQQDQKNIISISSQTGSLISGQKTTVNFVFKKDPKHPDYNQSANITITWNNKASTSKDFHYKEISDFVKINYGIDNPFNIYGIYPNTAYWLSDLIVSSYMNPYDEKKNMSISQLLTKHDDINIINIDYKYNNKQYEIPIYVYWNVTSKAMNDKKINLISRLWDQYTIVSDGTSVWISYDDGKDKWIKWNGDISKNTKIIALKDNYIETNNGIYVIGIDGYTTKLKLDSDLKINQIYKPYGLNINYYATNKGLYYSEDDSFWLNKITSVPSENIISIGEQNGYVYIASNSNIYQGLNINIDAFKNILTLQNNLKITNIISDDFNGFSQISNYFETNNGLYQLNYENDKYVLDQNHSVEKGSINYFSNGLFSINNNIYTIDEDGKITKITNTLNVSGLKSAINYGNYIIANNNLYEIINNKLSKISIFDNDNFTYLTDRYFIDNNKLIATN